MRNDWDSHTTIEKIEPQLNRESKARPSRSIALRLAESEIYNYAPDFFFSLAHWAKQEGRFEPWERRFVFAIGRYLARGWQITQKQERQAVRIIREATEAGFLHVGGKPSLRPQPQAGDDHIYRLGLSPRTCNLLLRKGIKSISWLATLREGQLLAIRGLGRKGLEDIKVKLNAYPTEVAGAGGRRSQVTPSTLTTKMSKDHSKLEIASGSLVEPSLIVQLREAHEQLRQQLFSLAGRLCGIFESHGLLEELHLPSEARWHLYQAIGELPETLADLRQLVESQSAHPSGFEPDQPTRTTGHALPQAVRWFDRVLGYASVDDEVNDLVGRLTDRERFILNSRFQLQGKLTLEATGNQFQITRERVRQIEAKVQKKLVSAVKRSSLFYSTGAIILLRHLGEDATPDSWRQQLIDRGFVKDQSSADLLVAICRATNSSRLGLPERFSEIPETRVSPRILFAKKRVLEKALKLTRNCGAVRVASLIVGELSEADVEQILASDGFSTVLPGWWTKEVGKSVAKRISRKAVAYCGPVSPPTMRHALRKHLSRFQFPTPPSEVLAKTLEETGELVLADGLLRLNNMAAEKPSLTGPESVFLRLVNDESPIVTFESIYTNVTAEGFSSASVTSLLMYSPIVQKVSFGLYSLLGAHFNANDVEEARARVTRVSANSTVRPRPDGVIEFETNAGTWLKYGGIVCCGRANVLKGSWTTVVGGVDQGELIIERGFIRGLSKASESLDIVPGDRIRIEFNTWNREASITTVVNHEQIS